MDLFIKEKINVHGVEINMPMDLYETIHLLKREKLDGLELGVGEHDGMLFAEVRDADIISMAIFDPKKKVLKGLRINSATRYVDGDFSDANFEDRICAIALLITYAEANEGAAVKIEDFRKKDRGPLVQGSPEEYAFRDALSVVESDLSILVRANKQAPTSAFLKTPQTINLSQVETGILMPSKIILGHFEGFKSSGAKRNVLKRSDIGDKYILNPNRTYTEEEKMRLQKTPDWQEMSSMALSIGDKIKSSWDLPLHLRERNFIMEGPKGTGKTVTGHQVADITGLPLYVQVCSANMDESDIKEKILPVAEEVKKPYIPTEDEFFFDPAGCYERAEGKTLSEEEKLLITEEDAREAVKKALERYKNRDTTPYYETFLSEVVKCFENGGICQIEEPSCIADPGVLIVLNSALEPDGIINLSTRTVRRHPECIFILTTNRDYDGCRPLNAAFRDRSAVIKAEMPSVEEQISMLKAATDCTDEALLERAVTAADALNGYLKDNSINNSVSLRGLTKFVSRVMRGYDIRETAMETMVYVISTDDEEVAEMETFLEMSTNLFS